ncbi:hypothetical protein [Siccibacter turicensis]|uniref:hypothetical protein n=1 Tax=Siccibacter turicensis TaxID=357233 RepID=UPI003F57BB69
MTLDPFHQQGFAVIVRNKRNMFVGSQRPGGQFHIYFLNRSLTAAYWKQLPSQGVTGKNATRNGYKVLASVNKSGAGRAALRHTRTLPPRPGGVLYWMALANVISGALSDVDAGEIAQNSYALT